MNDERFTLDTNVLVYALDRQAGARHVAAARIVGAAPAADCCLTLQSISEFFAAATRKRLVPRHEALAQTRDWLDMFQTCAASANALRAALASADAGRAAYRDALLVATAAEAGCVAILTEDLADGAVLHGVRIINPFAAQNQPAIDALLSPD